MGVQNYSNKVKKRRDRRFEASEYKTRDTIQRIVPKPQKLPPRQWLISQQKCRELDRNLE